MGNQVKHFRKMRKLTQQQLADKLGIHLTNFNKLENGKSDPDISRFDQLAEILGVSTSELLADAPNEPRRLSLDDEWREDMEAIRPHEGDVYDPDAYKPRIPGAIPEIDVQAGAGEGAVGDMLTLQLGGESYSGHKITGEWLFPEEWLRAEINASASKTMVMPIKGDSMEPTYRPGDRVLVDLSQKTITEDTVYVISDGQSAPRIKRLVEVMFSKPRRVKIVSDNVAIGDQEVDLEDLTIIGRVVGVVSRR